MQWLNYSKGKAEYEDEDTYRFHEATNAYAKQLLYDANEIYFKPIQKMFLNDTHIFGNVHILKHNGQMVDLLRELMNRNDVRMDANAIPFGKLNNLKSKYTVDLK